MSYRAKLILVGLVSLLLGVVAGGGYVMREAEDLRSQLVTATQQKQDAQQTADRLRKLGDTAVRKYSSELGRLVQASAAGPAVQPPASQPADAPVSADSPQNFDSVRAIVATRDIFLGALDALRSTLDSEFDALATELNNPTPNAETVKQVMDNLRQKWPEKEKSIDAATRRLLSDLGVLSGTPISSAPALPADVSAAPVTPPPVVPAPAPAIPQK